MKNEDKKYFMLMIILLAVIVPVCLILRTLALDIADEHGLQYLVNNVLAISDFLLVVCVGLGLLNILFYIHLWFEERKTLYFKET